MAHETRRRSAWLSHHIPPLFADTMGGSRCFTNRAAVSTASAVKTPTTSTNGDNARAIWFFRLPVIIYSAPTRRVAHHFVQVECVVVGGAENHKSAVDRPTSRLGGRDDSSLVNVGMLGGVQKHVLPTFYGRCLPNHRTPTIREIMDTPRR